MNDPIRDRVVALVAELADTLSDPTQAWDIAVADFEYEVLRLAHGAVGETTEKTVLARHLRPHATFGDDPSGWCGCADCDPRDDCGCRSCREVTPPGERT